jgi:hypothetical protein
VIEVVQHFICVLPYIEKPLTQKFLFDLSPRAPRAAIGINLFIGQDCLVNGVPVDIGVFLVSETVFKHQREYLLSVFVIRGLMSGQLSLPIKGKA